MLGRGIMVAAVAAGVGAAVTLALGHGGAAGPPDVAQAAQAPPAAAPLAQYLRFTGTGTVHVRPDTAGISFTTSGTGGSKGEAVAGAGAGMRRVIDAMQRHGVHRSDLQTSSDVYDDTSRGVWVASESLQVTVHDTHAVAGLISRGLAAGADSSSGPQYSLSDHSTGYDAALQAAIADARAHADAAAALIGAHVTGVISVEDTSTAQPVPIYGAAADALSSVPAMPQRQGTQDVTVGVIVTFSYATG
jgi:uncharacterized protein YggE